MKKLQDITGSEFGLFEYHEEPKEVREEKWLIIARLLEEGRIKNEEVNALFENNPFVADWYRRVILSDVPISETYH